MKSEHRQGIFQLVIVLVFVGVAIGVSLLLRTAHEPPQQQGGGERIFYAETERVRPGPYQIEFETTGLLETLVDVQVTPEVGGRVVAVSENFYDGGTFAAGEVVFQIDRRDYEVQVERLEAEVARAETALKLAEAEAATARAEWSRVNRDRPISDLAARVPQLEEAAANLKAVRAQLANARLSLSRTEFRLPKAGRVLDSRIAEGQYVQAGQPQGTVFYLDALEVTASLQGQELKWLNQTEDPRIEIVARFLGEDQRYRGRLNRGASMIDAKTRFATIRIGFEEEPKNLLPGVFTEVKFQGPRLEQIARMPVSALQSDGTVWLVDETDDTLEAFTPRIVRRTVDEIAVDNLEGARRVVTSRLAGATPGARIAPPGEENAPE